MIYLQFAKRNDGEVMIFIYYDIGPWFHMLFGDYLSLPEICHIIYIRETNIVIFLQPFFPIYGTGSVCKKPS